MEVKVITSFQELDKGGEEAKIEWHSCHSRKNWKDGVRETNFGSVQRFKCRDCGYRFSEKSNIASWMNRGFQLSAILEEAKKLDTQAEIKTVCAGEKGQLVEYTWKLKKRGLKEKTIEVRTFLLNQLS
jgi:hypothetical protein